MGHLRGHGVIGQCIRDSCRYSSHTEVAYIYQDHEQTEAKRTLLVKRFNVRDWVNIFLMVCNSC